MGDWHGQLTNAQDLLARLMEDEDPRVRLGALYAARQIGTPRAGDVVTLARHWPMDPGLEAAYEATREILGAASGSPASLRAKAIATSNADLSSGEMTPQAASVMLERQIYEKEHRVGLHRAAVVLARRQKQSLAEYFVSRLADRHTPARVLTNIGDLLSKAGAWEFHFARDELIRIAETAENPTARRTAYAALLIGASTSRTLDEVMADLTARDDFNLTEVFHAMELVAEQSSVKTRVRTLVRDELAKTAPPDSRQARYVRVISPRSTQMRFVELEVRGGGKNLAKGKIARQFSAPEPAPWWVRNAGAGVNGVTDPEEEAPVNHGAEDEEPIAGVAVGGPADSELWWEVDLGKLVEIEEIALFPAPGGFQAPVLRFELRDEAGEVVYATHRPASEAKIEVDVQLAPERIAAATKVARKLGDDFKNSLITVAKFANHTDDRFAAMRALARIGGAPAELKITKVRIEATEDPAYKPAAFSVDPRDPVEIVLKNSNGQAVNVAILEPGTEEDVGKLIETANAGEIPESAAVLHATSLVRNGESAVLQFLAPSKPGSYPFLSTTPGHWQVLRGVLTVVAPPPPPPPKPAPK